MIKMFLLSIAITIPLIITGGEGLEEFLKSSLSLIEAFFSSDLSFDVSEITK